MKNQEHLFCMYYARLIDPTKAALKTGFDNQNAESVALKLLQRKDIIAKVNEILQSGSGITTKSKAIAGLERLAFGEVNDSVKLMFNQEDLSKYQIGELDLFHVSEIKRPKDGSLEIKFADRFKAIEKLLEISQDGENSSSIGDFYGALMQSADSIRKQG